MAFLSLLLAAASRLADKTLLFVVLAVWGIQGSDAQPDAPVYTTLNQLLARIHTLIPMPSTMRREGRENPVLARLSSFKVCGVDHGLSRWCWGAAEAWRWI